MTVKYVTSPNGKLRIQLGRRNAREWLAWLEESNANGVAKITSIDHIGRPNTPVGRSRVPKPLSLKGTVRVNAPLRGGMMASRVFGHGGPFHSS